MDNKIDNNMSNKMWLIPDPLKVKIISILGELKASVVFKTLVELNTLQEYTVKDELEYTVKDGTD